MINPPGSQRSRLPALSGSKWAFAACLSTDGGGGKRETPPRHAEISAALDGGSCTGSSRPPSQPLYSDRQRLAKQGQNCPAKRAARLRDPPEGADLGAMTFRHPIPGQIRPSPNPTGNRPRSRILG